MDNPIQHAINRDVEEFLEINKIAEQSNISHAHFTDTTKKHTGNHPCHFYHLKIIDEAKNMLNLPHSTVADVAKKLTYDPSNFSSFFLKSLPN